MWETLAVLRHVVYEKPQCDITHLKNLRPSEHRKNGLRLVPTA